MKFDLSILTDQRQVKLTRVGAVHCVHRLVLGSLATKEGPARLIIVSDHVGWVVLVLRKSGCNECA